MVSVEEVDSVYATPQPRSAACARLKWVAALVVCFVAGVLTSEVAHAKPAAIPDHAFVLIVSVTLRSAEQMAQLERTFQPLASYIVANEPTTLSYELLKSDRDPNRAAIIERYADKENAYKRVHRTSAAFRAFRPVLQEMGAQLDGHSYVQTGLGFMSRREA